jgi:hypothetical protein
MDRGSRGFFSEALERETDRSSAAMDLEANLVKLAKPDLAARYFSDMVASIPSSAVQMHTMRWEWPWETR